MAGKTKQAYVQLDETDNTCCTNNRKRTQFCLFVVCAVLVIILLAVGLFFLTNNTSPGVPTLKPSPSILGKYKHAALATDHSICSEIGRTILEKQGGSSVDATIAVQICYSVIQPQSSGIGGGFFMVVYNRTSRESTSIDAREVAPLAASEDMFVDKPGESEVGGKSIAVPSEIHGYKKAHDRFGRLPWSALFAPSIKLCMDGFPVPQHLEDYWIMERNKLAKDPDTFKTYTDPATGDFYKAGEIIKLPALGKTLQTIATEGAESFYSGNLSKNILLDLKEKGSLITAQDLLGYQTLMSKSLQSSMRDGSTLYSPGAPSGGAILIFIMNILDGYEIASGKDWKKEDKLLAFHRVTEAFKFAYAKRTDMGDPKFIKHVDGLVANLTSMDYADAIRKMIWDNATHDWPYYGPTYYDKYKTSTAHASIVGNDNLAVAVTTTVNLRFGSGVMGSRTGILFNDEMDDFSTPNKTNFFGVAPSPSNFIRPGKRPVSSMCPAILITKDNKIKMVVGAAGGTRITTATAYVMTNILWFGDTVKQAVDYPRIHHQLLPPEVSYEQGFPEYYVNGLRELGHNVTLSNSKSIVNAITGDGSWFYANSDYRRPGSNPDGF
ncbi:gamma-glutamyltranspeptidase 1-like isoform X2 [Mizuhopecten yessoensis]|uniref:gamma-glutamyltranspeptidase 1-like isoform X2 n=1 Tax=Mizuhopecten yessoensis TaxID=6573 RepID=UPI000B4590CF|nr:gamma-glutamyltranspeptidase 1-like isoform X2 [Mizuhopecten yessoensis]